MKKLPPSDYRNAIEPDEIIDPTLFARDLTARVGATARFAFRRSVEENTHGIRAAVSPDHEMNKVEEWPAFVQEVYAALYDPDGLSPIPAHQVSTFGKKAIASLAVQPSFPSMRVASAAHRSIAALAAVKLSIAVGNALGLRDIPDEAKEDPRSIREAADGLQEMLKEMGASDEQIAEAEEKADEDVSMAQSVREKMISNLEETMKRPGFSKKVSQIADVLQHKAEAVALLVGCGMDPTTESGDEGVSQELIDMLAANPQLMEILKECGRLRTSAAAKGLSDIGEGNCDVVGVVPGDDVLRMLPSELALLDDEDFGDEALRRIVDGDALTWDLRGTEERDSGDIVILVDRSGSMTGGRIIAARALAAAVMLNALSQKRRVTLTMFSTSTDSVGVTGKGGIGEAIRLLGLPADGGTDVATGLESALTHGLQDLREPDVLIITDGCFYGTDDIVAKLDKFPKETRALGLMVGDHWREEHTFLDEQWNFDLNLNNKDELSMEILRKVGHRRTRNKKAA